MKSNGNILNRFFTKQVISSLIDNKHHEIFEEIIAKYLAEKSFKDNNDAISKIYKYMQKNYRNEYIYINTLLNKLLLGKHSLKTTTAITQLSIGNSKADFILLNGRAIVYEIKTELDSFDRLLYQIEDYYKAFYYVNVVTCDKNYYKLYKLLKDTPTGIYILSDRNTLQEKKKALENKLNIDYRILFKILRKYEFESIILDFYNKLPESTPVFYYDECFKLFRNIPIDQLYKLFLKELKKRNFVDNIDEFNNIPYELKSLVYFSNFKSNKYDEMLNFLNRKYKEECECIIRT